MDLLDYNKAINELTNHIAASKIQLQNGMLNPVGLRNPAVPPSTLSPSQVTADVDITALLKKVVNEALDERFSKNSNESVVPVSQPITEPVDYGTQLLLAIGSALSEEQQIWLSLPENQVLIPDFLLTLNGQAFTKRFFLFYKEFKESKCK